MGPAPTTDNPNCQFCNHFNNTSGRITALAYDGAGTLYAGSAAGGVWKQTVGSASWTPLTDDQDSLVVGSLALDPNNSQTIYAGTGEPNRSDSLDSAGVLKSTDGGAHWTLLGKDLFGAANKTTPDCPDFLGLAHQCGVHISNIAVDPTNDSNVLVGADDGVYRSTSGGADGSWSAATFYKTDGSTIVPTGAAPLSVDSMFFVPMSSTVYAMVGNNVSFLSDANDGLYRSTDGGATWRPFGTCDVTCAGGRGALAYAPSDPKVMYMTIANDAGASLGVWRSPDDGATWTQTTGSFTYGGTNPDLFGGSFPSASTNLETGWYNQYIAVDPNDSGRVYVGGIDIWESVDSGSTFTNITRVYGANTYHVHPDQHAIAFVGSPAATGYATPAYFGNDGGVYHLTEAPGGFNWTDDNGNLSLTQFYSVGYGEDMGAVSIYAGAQDNGTQKDAAGAFSGVGGGDGGFVAVNTSDPTNVWLENANGNIHHSIDGGTNYRVDGELNILGGFLKPIAMDPHNPNHVLAAGSSIYETTRDSAAGTGQAWHDIADNVMTHDRETATALAFAPSDTTGKTWYLGGNEGTLKVASDDGASFTDISAGTSDRYVTSIGPARDDAKNVVVTYAGFNSADGKTSAGHVYLTRDGGSSWTDITNNLPDAPVNTVLRNGTDDNTFYAGTDTGFYMTIDGGGHWMKYNNGMPNVPIYDMVDTGANILAATHGRGMYAVLDSYLPTSVMPSAPTAVHATTGDEQATVSWTAPDYNGSSPITAYTVTASDGSQVSVDGNTTSATVLGLTDGTPYSFTVTAGNASYASAPSAPSNTVTPAPGPPPGPPMNVSATPGNGSATIT